jgi:hypothetical protein
MLKMMGKGEREDGSPITLIVFGLSDRNLDLLRDGRPIKFSGSDVGISDEFEFIIFAGKDEREMQSDFAQFVGPNTELHIDPRFKD